MRTLAWRTLAGVLGMLAGVAARQLTAALWPTSPEPPLNPADRRIGWRQAMAWAVTSGIGAGVARLVSRRAAAAGWNRMFDEAAPGVAEPRPLVG